MKKTVYVLLLVGFLFNVFHDFVFYNIDPCMSDVVSVLKFEKGENNDPLCEIHSQLHENFLFSQTKVTKNVSYKSPPLSKMVLCLSYFKVNIFKPPRIS